MEGSSGAEADLGVVDVERAFGTCLWRTLFVLIMIDVCSFLL